MKKISLISLCFVLICSIVTAKTTTNEKSLLRYTPRIGTERGFVSDHEMYPVQRAAAAGTTYLAYFTFDDFPDCDEQGWTSVDLTAPAAEYFHVDDFSAGTGNGSLAPIQGAQSMWCGLYPTTASPWCAYAVLPGYGNIWDQALCSPCTSTVDTMVTVDYYVQYDSEPGYDGTTLEWANCTPGPGTPITPYTIEPSIDGGTGIYWGAGGPVFESIDIDLTGQFMLRFHFVSDGAWSDEDGMWDTDGAVILDSITVSDGSGIIIATENFEGAGPPADWVTCSPPGYGDLAQLVHALPTTYQNDPVQEDPCVLNISCLWNFFKGSTYNYACNTPNPSPQQQVIPYGNARDQYISNEIWSPWIPFTGSGSVTDFAFDVYRDLKLDAVVFFVWHLRAVGPDGCASGWGDRAFVFYGDGKDWFRSVNTVGDLISSDATHVQLALGTVDMCAFWCGTIGSGACHAHSPLFDNVELYRVDSSGPQFFARDIDMFQDNFSADGTIVGTCRADMAQDIIYGWSSPRLLPGDSAKVQVDDPEVGLGFDPTYGGPAVYCFLDVDGPNRTTVPADIQAPEQRAGLTRFPYVGTAAAAGRTWDYFRMDTCFTSGGGLVWAQYCIDFNDNLFVPGDTCWFFFGAQNFGGNWAYISLPYGQSSSMSLVAGAPDEFTMLPAVGDEPGNDILYVDGMNFRGAQPFFDTAFQNMNLAVDRYDVRGPSSNVSNRLSSRVVNVLNQLIPVYNKIIWNTGDLSQECISDGTGSDKTDDATLLLLFCDLHTAVISGIYFSGDDLAHQWSTSTGPGAIGLRGYMAYTVTNPDHVAAGTGINPMVKADPATAAFHVTDSLIAYGGCPLINDFDVLAPVPPLSQVEMNYHTFACPPGPAVGPAILSQQTINPGTKIVRIVLSGFSYHYIRDIDNDGILDRHHHMWDIIRWLNNNPPIPIAARPGGLRTRLAQNYPNPFNPVTTIKYTIKEQAHVSLRVYNVAGQLVRTLVNEVQKPDGVKPVEWHGFNNSGQPVASGVYFYKLVTKDFSQTKKMVLLK